MGFMLLFHSTPLFICLYLFLHKLKVKEESFNKLGHKMKKLKIKDIFHFFKLNKAYGVFKFI